jgi:hypothetical protein
VQVVKQVQIGVPIVVKAVPKENRYGVVFEDDGNTGYLYGLDQAQRDMPIVDALHIYNVVEPRRGHNITVKIVWNADHTGAILFVQDSPQAVFDFARSQMCCRTGFPPTGESGWYVSHDWDDAVYRRVNADGS